MKPFQPGDGSRGYAAEPLQVDRLIDPRVEGDAQGSAREPIRGSRGQGSDPLCNGERVEPTVKRGPSDPVHHRVDRPSHHTLAALHLSHGVDPAVEGA